MKPVKRILVLGGGFAGLWSAVGAVRKLDEIGQSAEVTLVNRDGFHNIRVRNYEADLKPLLVPLDDVLEPVGVKRVEGDVTGFDFDAKQVSVGSIALPYDRLVFALGSQLARPAFAANTFDVDTYAGAARLDAHLRSLPKEPQTVVIVGAGLTGIEAACEMPDRLKAVLGDAPFRVILADHNPQVGSDMGESARPVIEEALQSLGVETRLGVRIASVDAKGITLEGGEAIPASTVIWCAGMKASPLTQLFPGDKDRLGRVTVDEYLRVAGVPDVFAAGDSASCMVDPGHPSVMSCQHGRPMGRYAGHNVVADLFGLPMLPLKIDWYVTVLDLGPWGAVYTEGWDRRVVAKGEKAKQTKMIINRQRIYPPMNRSRIDILAAAVPEVQKPPAYSR